MTEYHYYDQGYNLRFGSASTKIYDYASVLNDVMLDVFNLKVCPYVTSCVSRADDCKIAQYGSVKTSNLASSCPGTGTHQLETCLTTKNLRKELEKEYGNGGGVISKVSWTGHIMTDHYGDRSNATVGMGTIIMTPYGLTSSSNNYVNLSNEQIRKENIFTLAHETIHQFDIYDHYCYDDMGGDDGVRCSNEKGCYKCYGNGVKPDCMMTSRKYPTETSDLLCTKCKSQVLEYLSNNF